MSSPKVAHETWTWRFPKCTAFPRNSFSFCRHHFAYIALPKCHIDSNNDALKHVPVLKHSYFRYLSAKVQGGTLNVWWLGLFHRVKPLVLGSIQSSHFPWSKVELWPAGAEDTAPFCLFSLWAKATWNTEHSQVIKESSWFHENLNSRVASPPRWNKTLIRPN